MNQLELDPRTQAVLDRIRHSSKVLSIYEMPSDLAEAAVWEIGKLVLDPQHLPLVQYNTYRWFLREVSKLLRTKTGWDLALELEICLRKWVGFRLDPAMLQAFMRECCERIASMSPEGIEENPKSETRMTNQPEKSEARNANVGAGKGQPNDKATRASAFGEAAAGSGGGGRAERDCEKYLPFARELYSTFRRSPVPDFTRRTKLVVQRWFDRGLSGRFLWLIGQELLGRLYPRANV